MLGVTIKHRSSLHLVIPVLLSSTSHALEFKSCPLEYMYNSCTDADHHRLWCSLDSQYKGIWDYCRK